ncbi:MBL fold metallo-hydrolase [Tindallia californiensis]|uniref:Glyoxylase, beta-lactamase superfamily II n=1 Tax=Tindallia californiensis TaxID=159292 RepID=A0A1H3M7N0_9FIRM|nr:MBL fold metallo-hydrolase [Tindallia californiensis]SDY72747.1 Glyoxylase, beta-lactamase superfamily II [Tindallia californiensis]
MLLKHYFTGKIAHSSYMLAGEKTCAVIDPQRDVNHYIEEARQQGVTITHIIQTHLHADFISGHMDLAEKTGATIYVAKSAGCTFEHMALSEGDVIKLENMELQVLETPGHTPEHLSYVVIDKSRSDSPVGVFTGDTLFVGDVGRPDLFPDQAQELAGKLYHSLHEKLMKLPDYCEVYPAHGAGSLCGRSMGAKWRSTIGYERRFNQTLQIQDKETFIKSLTENMPPAPDHFSRCSDVNRKGPEKVKDLPLLEKLSPTDFCQKTQEKEYIVLDTRNYLAFGSQHIPGSWHLDLNGNFPTFAGWVLPTDKKIIVVADDFQKAQEAVLWARRAGVDQIVAYLDGGITSWVTAGLRTASVQQISAETLHNMVVGEEDFVMLDVRAPGEYEDSHIEGAYNIPVAELRSRYEELDRNRKIVLACSSGNRSSLGSSILEQKGFKHLINVAGGMSGYSAAGHAKECRACINPHGSRFYAKNNS